MFHRKTLHVKLFELVTDIWHCEVRIVNQSA